MSGTRLEHPALGSGKAGWREIASSCRLVPLGDADMNRFEPSTVGGSLRGYRVILVLMGFVLIVQTGWAGDRAKVESALRRGPGVANHPVNIIPSSAVSIPDGWPLGAGGTLTCLTCHERLPSLDGGGGAFLRGSSNVERESGDFCATCHGKSTEHNAAGMHWMAIDVAHVKEEYSGRGGRTGQLDRDSRRCMGCHDGVSASDSDNTTAWNRGSGSGRDHGRNHPVGVPYSDRRSPRGSVQLRPASLLPKKIRLPSGQVSCISCHDLYSRERRRLAVTIEESALCFSCHDMD
ncbi:MAG: hypothetical protein GY842_02830 [bacterium]|nr:hypothetical protein [bacterium]